MHPRRRAEHFGDPLGEIRGQRREVIVEPVFVEVYDRRPDGYKLMLGDAQVMRLYNETDDELRKRAAATLARDHLCRHCAVILAI